MTPAADGPYPPEPTVQALTPGGWLMQNGPFIVLVGAALAFAYARFGGDALLSFAKAGLGLGFVIFIHELGHFLAAKWCDVHVLTFSIGFGPALPGCSFVRGETTYKLAMLPLGGFVNMVGEGPEADEEEDYPRSFKNKTVYQRMFIISAGVIMNVLFGAAVFIAVYLTVGAPRIPAVMGVVSPGSRAWEVGVHSGWALTALDDKKDPWWEEMQRAVAHSRRGQSIEFEFTDRNGTAHPLDIQPVRDANEDVPRIGVAPPPRLRLPARRYEKRFRVAALATSAAGSARAIDLAPGDVVVAATDPREPARRSAVASGAAGWADLADRVVRLSGQALTLEVRRAGATTTEKVVVGDDTLEFEDSIVGMTDPATPDSPFNVTDLPVRLPAPGTKDPGADYFEYRRRLQLLAGKPVALRVRRAPPPDDATRAGPLVTIFVPPAYTFSIGARMKMGKVAAIRKDSPAGRSGLEAGAAGGDVIRGVKMLWKKGPPETLDEKALDPVRLPFELDRRAHQAGRDPAGLRIELTVVGTEQHNQHNAAKERTLPPMAWDDSFSLTDESPLSPSSPLSIPQLGIAYWVESTVVKVEPGSPAALAGLKPFDEVQKIKLRRGDTAPDKIEWTSKYTEMVSKRGRGQEVYDQWAFYFTVLQGLDYPEIRLKVKRDGKEIELPSDTADDSPGVVALPDPTWPLVERGLRLSTDLRRKKATSIAQAISFGIEDTVELIQLIYRGLSRLLTNDISTRGIGGPIEIGTQAFAFAGEDLATFSLFLAMISINLAVVNFLPIPLLDGGHMVFLIYEWLRRRPPSEMVRIVATYIGLAFILSLMVFVLAQDVIKRWF